MFRLVRVGRKSILPLTEGQDRIKQFDQINGQPIAVKPHMNKALTTALQNRGYDTQRTKSGAVWQGIGLA